VGEAPPTGVNGALDVNREGLTLRDLGNLTSADVFVTGVPAIFIKLLKTDGNTRTLANPQLRTAEGIPAQARFGERVPVPVTTFAPLASGGVNQQPITSFVYEPVGVNIDITPRMHHDDEVTLALKVVLSAVSGTGFGGLPTFANREISTTIRLKDGETNLLAGLIRDDERTVLNGVPGLSDLPLIGRLFASNRTETRQTDIILTLTPHIVRVLDLSESDLEPFRMGRDLGSPVDPQELRTVPRDRVEPPKPPAELEPPAATPAFPQPLQPPLPPGVGGSLPGTRVPVTPPKKPGGGGN
jgi:general secretion pathway protein D